MPKNFSGVEVGALRNTVGNGRIVRILDARHIHDSVWDDLAKAKNLVWNAQMPYLTVEYPESKQSISSITGRLVLDTTPIAPFKAETYSDFRLAQADYIADARNKAGKEREEWTPGNHNKESEE